MTPTITRAVLTQLLKTNRTLILLLVFVLLLGLANVLVVNQRITLYLFYIPVVVAAWFLPKRDAVSVAILAALMVVAYVIFVPSRTLGVLTPRAYFWAELTSWGGILVVTAWVVCSLRAAINRAMEDLKQALADLKQAYSGVLEILSKFIRAVDTDTADHCVRVSGLAVRIAKTMGLGPAAIEEARVAGLLHDVGKTEVSVMLLRKSASLSAEERAQVGTHVTRGAEILESVGGMLAHVADAVEMHHEKFDGSGYKKLKGEQIPLLARIVAGADSFDAMVSDRPYRKGMALVEARDALVAASGTHFDPNVVAALKTIVDNDWDAAAGPAAEGWPQQGVAAPSR